MAVNPYNLSEPPIITGTEPTGALTGLGEAREFTPELPAGSLGAFEYPVFQVESFAPENPVNLQNVYGTTAMPIFEWAKQVQSGQRIYDPSSPIDQELVDQYNEALEAGELPADAPSWEDIAKPLAAQTAAVVGSNVAQALTDPYIAGGVTDKILAGGQTSIPYFGDPLPKEVVNKSLNAGWDMSKAGGIPDNSVFIPELASQEAAAASGNLQTFNKLNSPNLGTGGSAGQKLSDGSIVYDTAALQNNGITVDPASGTASGSSLKSPQGGSVAITAGSTTPTYWDGVTKRFTANETWAQAGTMALVSTGINIAMGMKPVEAVKAGGSAAFAYAMGTAIAGPVGGWIASTFLAKPVQKVGSKVVEETKELGSDIVEGIKDVGSSVVSGAKKIVKAPVKAIKKVAGRVICNELRRQGLLSTRDVILDYKFTREHLTPQHVAGYHFWAVGVVKKLRKGERVKFWKHIASHRANEIAYIYGQRDKPDYLGKIYRRIFEPVCWTVGLFCKETDWSILYEDKQEI